MQSTEDRRKNDKTQRSRYRENGRLKGLLPQGGSGWGGEGGDLCVQEVVLRQVLVLLLL